MKKMTLVLLAAMICSTTLAAYSPVQADGKVDAASLEEWLKKKKKG